MDAPKRSSNPRPVDNALEALEAIDPSVSEPGVIDLNRRFPAG